MKRVFPLLAGGLILAIVAAFSTAPTSARTSDDAAPPAKVTPLSRPRPVPPASPGA